LLLLLITFFSLAAIAQKVANYAFKKYGQRGYETYGFWTGQAAALILIILMATAAPPLRLPMQVLLLIMVKSILK
jgi:hypothetical protein